jgi:hypothetical protein
MPVMDVEHVFWFATGFFCLPMTVVPLCATNAGPVLVNALKMP